MKKLSVLFLVIALVIAFSSCSPAGVNEVSDIQEIPQEESGVPSTAKDFLGMKLGDVIEMFGDDYSATYFCGSYVINFSNVSDYAYFIDYNGESALKDRIIKRVSARRSGNLDKKIVIGMTQSEIEELTGQKLDIVATVEQSELITEPYYCIYIENGYTITIEFDNNMTSTFGHISKSDN